MTKRMLITGAVLFAALWMASLLRWMPPIATLFTNDALHYSAGAKNLLAWGMYSIDGQTPFFGREPGMSFFLAALYTIFGIENGMALFVVQGVLYFLASCLFSREIDKQFGSRTGTICFFLLLTSVSIFHTIFSAYRECLALLLFLVAFAMLLKIEQSSPWWIAFGAGVALGFGILTYISFLFFPIILLPILLRSGVRWRDIAIVLCSSALVVTPWFIRIVLNGDRARLESEVRMTYVWHVRGVQAEEISGLMPLRCLYAEYISRDWTGLPESCSFNAIKNRLIASGDVRSLDTIAQEGKEKILRHPMSYAWFSLVDIIELHLPFVGGGWSTEYHLLAAISSIVLYLGFLAGSPRAFDRRLMLFLVFAFYNTLFFILTDATPRYLLPTLFCYAAIAAIGYDRLLTRFHR